MLEVVIVVMVAISTVPYAVGYLIGLVARPLTLGYYDGFLLLSELQIAQRVKFVQKNVKDEVDN